MLQVPANTCSIPRVFIYKGSNASKAALRRRHVIFPQYDNFSGKHLLYIIYILWKCSNIIFHVGRCEICGMGFSGKATYEIIDKIS